MSKIYADSKRQANGSTKVKLEDIVLHVPIVVRKACHNLGYHPDTTELNGLGQQIILLLMKNDCKTLRSFNCESSKQTWLYVIAKRYITKYFRKQRRFISLEDIPPDSLTAQPDQEDRLIFEDKMKRLFIAINNLTGRERELFCLWLQGTRPAEIATKMNIKRASVYKMRNVLMKKLQKFTD